MFKSEFQECMDDLVYMEDMKPYLDAREWVEEALDAVYTTGCVADLENALQELSAIWEIPLRRGEAKVHGTESKWFDMAKLICGGKR